MFFERKVFFEFLDRESVRITTPFIQKTFDLKHTSEIKRGIDLINLKLCNSDARFYALIDRYRGIDGDEFLATYSLEVYVNNKKIKEIYFEDKNSLIKVKTLE